MQLEPVRSVSQELPAQAAWLRRLARGLTQDAASADDVAQDTWLAALQHGPRDPSRSWLAHVAANFARRYWRQGASRERLERAVSRPEGLPAADEVAARLDLQRALADELGALREPHRTTLFLHYIDGRTAARIAREQGVPAATVRARIRQGLAELRARLDRRCGGDRTEWRLALLPFALGSAPHGFPKIEWVRLMTLAQGVLAMKGALQMVAAGAVALAVGLGVWWSVGGSDAASPPEIVAAPAPQPKSLALPEVAKETERESAGASVQGALDPALASAEVPAAAAEAPPARVAARCVDAQARPVAGARLTETESRATALSAADGRVALELAVSFDRGTRILRADADGLTTLFLEVNVARSTTTNLGDLVLAPAGTVAGRVEDVDGRPIAGAAVSVTKPDLWHDIASAKRCGPRAWPGAPSSTSLADGTFSVEGIAAGGARAWAEVKGMRYGVSGALTVRADAVTDGVVLVAEPLDPKDEITGVIVSPEGEPVPRASLRLYVAAGGASNVYSAPVDGDGRFRFRLLTNAPHKLRAVDQAGRWQDAEILDVPPGTRDVELRFTQNRWIDVAVRAGSKTVERFAVVSYDATGEEMIEGTGNLVREDGHAHLRVPMQRFRVEAVAPGYALARKGPFEPATPPASLEFDLVPEPGISGTVTASGAALAGAKVTLRKCGTSKQQIDVWGYPSLVEPTTLDEFVTSDDGSFFLRVRSGGEFIVRAEHSEHAPGERGPLAAQPGVAIDDVDIALGAGGAIEGRVLVEAGRSPEGVIVAINRGDAHVRTMRSNEQGRFRFDRLMPGRWSVARGKEEIVDYGSPSWSIGSSKEGTKIAFNCDVYEGSTTRADVDLRDEELCVLDGHVTLNGQPAKNWTVTAWPGDRSSYTGELPSGATDERGDFRIVIEEVGVVRVSMHPPIESGQLGRLDALTEVKRGANAWRQDWTVARVEGRRASGAGGEPLYYVCSSKAGTSAMIVVKADESGEFVLPYVPVGRGAFQRLESDADGAQQWVEVLAVDLKAGETLRVDLP